MNHAWIIFTYLAFSFFGVLFAILAVTLLIEAVKAGRFGAAVASVAAFCLFAFVWIGTHLP